MGCGCGYYRLRFTNYMKLRFSSTTIHTPNPVINVRIVLNALLLKNNNTISFHAIIHFPQSQMYAL